MRVTAILLWFITRYLFGLGVCATVILLAFLYFQGEL